MKDRSSSILFVIPYLIFVLFIPLLFLFISAVHVSMSDFLIIVLRNAFLQSFLQASVSTAIAAIIGLGIGILLILYKGKLRELVISLMLITYVLPGLIMAIGIISIFHYENRFLEIILGNVIFNSPMIAVLAYATGDSTSLQEINSAKILGARDSSIIREFYLPNAARGAMLGSLFTFILCFEGFSLPLIIGGPSYSTVEVLIYMFKRVFVSYSAYQFASASFISMLQFVTLLIPLIVYILIRPPPSRRNQELNYGSKSVDFSLPFLLIFLIFLFFPLFFIFVNYPINIHSLMNIQRRIGISVYSLTLNTVLFSIASSLLAFIISLLFVSEVSFTSRLAVMLPMVISPVSLALGFYLAYGGLTSSSFLVIFIFTAIEIPLTIRMVQQAVETIPFSERMSSRLLGDSRFASLMKVQISRIRNETTSVFSLIFITVMGEFSAIATVYTKSSETITVGIYQLLQLKDIPGTYTLTEIFVIVIFMSSLFINYLGKSGLIGKTYS